jgi:DNA polymerase-3 subunit chi
MPNSNKPEVWFYHLTSSTLFQVLPPLLMQILKREWRCVLQTVTPELMKELDSKLWTFSDKHFIPHGKKGDPFPDKQPIYITDEADDRPNTPDVILCVEAAEVPLDEIGRAHV